MRYLIIVLLFCSTQSFAQTYIGVDIAVLKNSPIHDANGMLLQKVYKDFGLVVRGGVRYDDLSNVKLTYGGGLYLGSIPIVVGVERWSINAFTKPIHGYTKFIGFVMPYNRVSVSVVLVGDTPYIGIGYNFK